MRISDNLQPVESGGPRGPIRDWRHGDIPAIHEWVPEGLYQDILDWMPVCCVDTVITRAGSMLLTLRRQEPQAGTWWIQGGRLRKGESLPEAATRTAQGESGLEVTLHGVLGVFSTMFDSSAHDNSTTHTINVTFLGSVAAEAAPRIDSAHDEFTWWPLDRTTGNAYIDQLAGLARASRQ